MIPAKELRSGNIVSSKGFDVPRQGIFSDRVDGRAYQFVTAYGIFLAEEGKVKYEPVPFSEDWLVKFGFLRYDYKWYQWDKVIYRTGTEESKEFAIEPDGNGEFLYISVDGNDGGGPNVFVAKIEFVHQLQNAWHILTGEELSIK